MELILLIRILQPHYFGAYATASVVSILPEQKLVWGRKKTLSRKNQAVVIETKGGKSLRRHRRKKNW
jgi:hypothetical protein